MWKLLGTIKGLPGISASLFSSILITWDGNYLDVWIRGPPSGAWAWNTLIAVNRHPPRWGSQKELQSFCCLVFVWFGWFLKVRCVTPSFYRGKNWSQERLTYMTTQIIGDRNGPKPRAPGSCTQKPCEGFWNLTATSYWLISWWWNRSASLRQKFFAPLLSVSSIFLRKSA